ncbi:MAG: hypothetical protein GC159_11140 [Phycisphaera sp.]|nr:hypothetical protein [Phycisphaera sp.]
MFDREAILPLAIGLVVALVLHIATAAGVVVLREHGSARPGEVKLETVPEKDWAAVSVSVSEPRVAGQASVITAKVRNTGTVVAPTGVRVLVTVDDEQVGDTVIREATAVGAAVERQFSYTAKSAGAKKVQVIVDPDDDVIEIDETNNVASATVVWRSPTSSAADPPDLAVVGFEVPEPRVVGRPARAIVDVANLGGVASARSDVVLSINGKPLSAVRMEAWPRPGEVMRLEGEITVDEPGVHVVSATADPLEKVNDRDRSNNTQSRELEWKDLKQRTPVGQLDPSETSVNWISHEDYEKLLARKSKVEQAAVQKMVDPAPVKNAPLDPTPPAPTTVAQLSQPTPPAPKQPEVEPTQTPKTAEPTERKADPVQPLKATEESSKKVEQAPKLDAKTEVVEAAATKQADPKAPTEIAATSPKAEPTEKAAPPEEAPKAREVALVVPPVNLPRVGDPLVPERTKTVTEPKEEMKRTAPPVKPDPEAKPAAESKKQEGEKSRRPEVASLPLVPVPTTEPGSPEKEDPRIDPKAIKTRAPERPENPALKEADGEKKTEEKTEEKSPQEEKKEQTPSAVTQVARPTAAPRDTAEAPPVTLIDHAEIKPGQVLAQQGIKINTVHPRFSAIALRTSLPGNPDVKIVFDKGGKVLHAEFTKSTGYDNVDGPLLASFYKWTAEGEPLSRVPETLTLKVHVLLTDED